MADKAIVKSIDDLEKLPEFLCGLWYSPYVKIYSIGGPNRIAEISNYPRAYRDTTSHVYLETDPAKMTDPEQLFKNYPQISLDAENLTLKGACNGCGNCDDLWRSISKVRTDFEEIKAGCDAIIKTTDAVHQWFLTGVVPAECGWDLYHNEELVIPTVGVLQTPLGAFPLWLESEGLPFTPDLEKHQFPISDIPGPIRSLSEASQRVGAAFVKLPEQAVANMRGKLATGKIALARKTTDLDKQIIRIKYQRVF